ncbi:Paired Amphipathic Helix Protein Sin3B [Manis pentadactyla]|nr:Paired Amphipathic Helix Protein Sin3B [Manis pentadactyla]
MKPGKKQSSEHAPPASWAATRQHLMLPLSFVLDPPREGEQNIQAPSISYLVSSALSSKPHFLFQISFLVHLSSIKPRHEDLEWKHTSQCFSEAFLSPAEQES